MTGRLITADRNASPVPSSQADIKPSPYRLPAPPLASSSSRPIKPPPSSATVANASASGSRAVAKPAPISPQSSLDLFDFGFGLPSSKAARKPVQTERFVLSSSPEPMPNRKPLALSNGKLVGRTSSYKPGKRPAELIELSDSSDEDFIARAAQFDKMNGLDRKKTKTGSPVPRPGPRKKFRPELVVGKGKARASSPDFGEREAWASHDAASQMARDKEQALRDVERLEAADRAKCVGEPKYRPSLARRADLHVVFAAAPRQSGRCCPGRTSQCCRRPIERRCGRSGACRRRRRRRRPGCLRSWPRQPCRTECHASGA
jgi:hypothetical protein